MLEIEEDCGVFQLISNIKRPMERSPWAFKMYKQKIFQAPPHKQKTTKPTHINLPSPPTALGGSSLPLTAQRPMERSPWAFTDNLPSPAHCAGWVFFSPAAALN